MTREETKLYLLSLNIPYLTEDRFKGIYWDLTDLDFSEKNLSGLVLHYCDFRSSNLNNVNLKWSDLRMSLFDEGTTLYYTDLRCAVFDCADCRGADFTGADIRLTSFEDAVLGNADFSDTDIGRYKKEKKLRPKLAKARIYKRAIVGTPFDIAVSKTVETVKSTLQIAKFYSLRFLSLFGPRR